MITLCEGRRSPNTRTAVDGWEPSGISRSSHAGAAVLRHPLREGGVLDAQERVATWLTTMPPGYNAKRPPPRGATSRLEFGAGAL